MIENNYSINDILLKLFEKQTTWLLMANKLTPLYYSITPDDLVQDMYIKIHEKLRSGKLKKTDIIIEGKVNGGVIYLTLRDLSVDIYRKQQAYYPKKKDIIQTENKTKEEHLESQDVDLMFFKNIDKTVNNFNWFYKKIFKLYTEEFQSMRKLSNATKISYKTIYNKIKICKDEIKKQLNNGK